MIEEHCIKTNCIFFSEGDNCWYWKHQKELCKMPAEMTKLLQPIWDKDFDELEGGEMKKCLGKFNGWSLSCSECAEMKECMELRSANFKNQLLRQADEKMVICPKAKECGDKCPNPKHSRPHTEQSTCYQKGELPE